MQQKQNQTASHSDYYHDWLPPRMLCNKRTGVQKNNVNPRKKCQREQMTSEA